MHPRLTGAREELAEGLATFALVLVGCGAILVEATTGQLGHVGVAFAFAAVITVMVYATGHVSGAHINPAITLAFAATGHFPWRRVPGYITAQVLGALTGATLLLILFGPTADLGATTLAADLPLWKGLLIEALATGVLAFVIASVATDARAQAPAAGAAIGLAVGIGALFAGPLTGGSMNPARTLGPALIAGTWSHAWIYLVGPILGAVGAMGLYELVRDGSTPEPGAAHRAKAARTQLEVRP